MSALPERRIRTVIFDLDGTLVRYHGVEFESSWGAIAAAAGVREASGRLLEEYLPRPDAYAEWVEKDAALLAGVPVARVTERILPPPYAKGVREGIRALRGRYALGILSSGVDLVADAVRDDLGLDFALANHLEVEDGHFTGRCELRVELWAKDRAMRALARERGLRLEEVCFVGDYLNDVPVMRLVGLAVALNPKDAAVEEEADFVTHDVAEIPAFLERAARG